MLTKCPNFRSGTSPLKQKTFGELYMNTIFDLLEEFPTQTIDRYFDGLPIWKTGTVKARIITECSNLSEKNDAEVSSSVICLIPPDQPKPLPGSRIDIHGITYDIISVESRNNISGELIAYRCRCGRV